MDVLRRLLAGRVPERLVAEDRAHRLGEADVPLRGAVFGGPPRPPRRETIGSLSCEREPLQRVSRDVDPVAHRVGLVRGVGARQEARHPAEDLLRRKRQVVRQDLELLVLVREVDEDRRRQSRVDVLRELERRGVVVHRGDEAEVGVRLHLHARDDRLDRAPRVEERRERGPRLLAHPVPLVEDRDASLDHRGDDARRDVPDAALACNDRSDQEILGPRVQRRLEEVGVPAHPLRRRVRERRLADARLADEARVQRQVARLDDEPRREELVDQVLPARPLERQLVRVRERDLYPLEANGLHADILGIGRLGE